MSPKIFFDQPGTYRILVQGRLDGHWAEYFDELRLEYTVTADGIAQTALTGSLPDQAAVQGVLQKLYNLGFPLVAVEVVD